MYLHTYDAKKKKNITAGEFSNGVFTKEVKPFHYMVTEKGYGIGEDVIKKLIDLGCTKVIIMAKTRTVTVPFADVLKSEVKDFGHGKQRFVRC